MNKTTVAAAWLVLAAMAAEAQAARRPRVKPKPAGAEGAIVQGNNRFGLELYGQIRREEGNLFFSPSSIHTALAMTYAGARGGTAAEMARTLHYGEGEQFFAEYGKAIKETVAGKDAKYELNIANALWLQQDKPFLEPFLTCNKQHFGAGLFDVDFKRRFEAARATINKWVEGKTKQKIKDLLPPGSLDAMTRMVLTNAIYFKGDWASQFKKAATREMDFHVSPDRKVKAKMMFQSERFGYTETPDLQALKMPYAGKELSMVVLLPKRTDGLAKVEKSLTTDSLAAIVGRLRFPRKVQVHFPRFKMEYKMKMRPILSKMGMPQAFSGKADFSGMTGSQDLYIDDVYHKAFVKVDEEGTEAAAATAVVMRLKSVAPSRPLVFKADHPFCFLIRHEKTGMILFAGRVALPKE
jgi:serpin B